VEDLQGKGGEKSFAPRIGKRGYHKRKREGGNPITSAHWVEDKKKGGRGEGSRANRI